MKFLKRLLGLNTKEQPKTNNVTLDTFVAPKEPDMDVNQFIDLRNQLLRCYLQFNNEMLKSKTNEDLSYIATMWASVAYSITEQIKAIFKLESGDEIRLVLKEFDVQIKKVKDSLPDFDSDKKDGFIKYDGPKGSA